MCNSDKSFWSETWICLKVYVPIIKRKIYETEFIALDIQKK